MKCPKCNKPMKQQAAFMKCTDKKCSLSTFGVRYDSPRVKQK